MIHDLFRQLDPKNGNFYFDRVKYPDDWYLKTDKVVENPQLANRFYQLEATMERSSLVGQIKKQRCLVNGAWEKPLNQRFKLPGRPTKRNFLQALIETYVENHKQDLMTEMIAAMEALDYWCVKRNQIIHGAKGISKFRLMEALQDDRQLVGGSNRSMNSDIQATIGLTCEPDEICDRMTEIITHAFAIVGSDLPEPRLVSLAQGTSIASASEPFYLYSDIRDWVIQRLDRDVQ